MWIVCNGEEEGRDVQRKMKHSELNSRLMYICTRDDRLRSLNSNTFSAPSQPAYNG
jgi:hypothetical protein